MLKPLTRAQQANIDRLLGRMTIEEKIGQTLNPVAWNFGQDPTDEQVDKHLDAMRRNIERFHVGCVFMANGGESAFRKVDAALKKASDIPIIVNADIETGPGNRVKGRVTFPSTMACGAANSPALFRTMCESIAVEGRAFGMHWTLAPVVDLCLNRANPMTICRTYGSRPDHVARMASAFIRTVQKNGRLAATAKHFPGDGYDDREPHICTSVMGLKRKEWMASYGVTWKAAIDAGVMAIMTGHIALPFVDPAPRNSHLGPLPATLSRKIQLDFLRGELGFDGLIVCDAATMIGFASHVAPQDRAWRSIEAGTDVYLFSNPEVDFPNMLAAVRDGRLSEERVEFAARKVLELKTRVGLFDGLTVAQPSAKEVAGYRKASLELARHSITIVRDGTNLLPLKNLKPGAKVLTITCMHTEGARHGIVNDMPVIDAELKARGFQVEHLFNPWGPDFLGRVRDYDAIFVNFNIPPKYGYTRLGPPASNPLWEAFWVGHPCVVFTAFGNPFVLYETPSVPNMVLTYCNSESSQAAAVKVWLGEEKALGKSPVKLDGYFECEV